MTGRECLEAAIAIAELSLAIEVGEAQLEALRAQRRELLQAWAAPQSEQATE